MVETRTEREPRAARQRGRLLLAGVLLAALPLATGCQSGYRAYSGKLVAKLEAGDYAGASELATDAAAKKKAVEATEATGPVVLYLLEAARAAQLAGDLERSLSLFQRAQQLMRPYLDAQAEAKITEAVATTMVNQSVRIYVGTPSDRVMCSALYGLELMRAGDHDGGRVALNLAADWQQEMQDRFAKQVEAAEAKAREEGVDRSSLEQARTMLSSELANLDGFEAYESFGNPFVDHVRGVYYLTSGLDRNRARQLFRRTAAIAPTATEIVAGDLEWFDAPIPESGMTWVYFLTGLSPHLEELRLDIPIPSSKVPYVAAAFPILKVEEDYLPFLEVVTAETSTATVELADLARVRTGEYKATLGATIAQEILIATLKATATYTAGEAGGDWAKLAAIVWNAASTSADTRSWRSLPRAVGVARVPTPADGELRFHAGREVGRAAVEPGTNNVVLVTLPATRTPVAAVSVIPIPRG